MDEVELANLALLRLGHSVFIEALDEASEDAQLVSAVLPIERDLMLEQHPWVFATKYAALADLGSPPDEWQYRYQYPADCLTARFISTGVRTRPHPPVPFEIAERGSEDGRVILTDQPQAVLCYTRALTVIGSLPTYFSDALAWQVAIALVTTKTKNFRLTQLDFQRATIALSRAKARDSNEGVRDPQPPSSYERARG
jgi:hypothetical protein